jgi:hypothetical protein
MSEKDWCDADTSSYIKKALLCQRLAEHQRLLTQVRTLTQTRTLVVYHVRFSVLCRPTALMQGTNLDWIF